MTARPFTPTGNTASLTTSTSSSRVEFNTAYNSRSVRLYNASTTAAEIIFVAFGDSTVTTATTTGLPIKPGDSVVLGCNSQSYVAAIAASGAPVLYATPGEGGS